MGPVTHFRHVTGAPLQSQAPRRRGASSSPGRIIRPPANRLSSSGPPASLTSPPRCGRSRFYGRPRMKRTGLVSVRSAARCHVPVRADRNASLGFCHPGLQPPTISASGAWVSTGVTLAAKVLGSGPGVAAAAALVGKSLAPSTSASYQRLWELFARFCQSANRCALPASPGTVCAYLGSLFEGGHLHGCSIRPYVAAIWSQHRRLALSDPTSHSLVVLARREFAAADARRRTGKPLRSAAYPAAAAIHVEDLLCIRSCRPTFATGAWSAWDFSSAPSRECTRPFCRRCPPCARCSVRRASNIQVRHVGICAARGYSYPEGR
jgi:hypothetical protein